MKKYAWLSFMLMMVLFTACAPVGKALESQTMNYEAPAEAPAPSMEMDRGMDYAGEPEVFEEAAGNSGIDLAAPKRLVIRNADLSIVVDEPANAITTISRMADRMGGYVVSSNMWKTRNYNGVEVPEGNITVRVPVDLLDQALDEIKQLTKNEETDVLSENVSGQDVTKEYTDLNSRLRNLEDAEAQLREILEDATETEDVLDVFNQLTYYREQIEVTKGQIQYYEESAALSAISIRIQAHEAVNPITVAGWKPSVTVSRALQALVNALQSIVDGAIWLILLIVPILIIILLPVFLAFLVIRAIVRRARRRKQEKSAVEEKTE